MAEDRGGRAGTAGDSAGLALAALGSGLRPAERLKALLELVPALTRATLAAYYAPDERAGALRLAESAGVPRAVYGLRAAYPARGRSALARAHGSGAAVWAGPAGPPEEDERPLVPAGLPLAVLPLWADGRRLGCLLAVGAGGEFDAEDRRVLQRCAHRLAAEAGGRRGATPAAPAAPESAPAPGYLTLAVDSGLVEADDRALELFGLAAGGFDGRMETLLAVTAPEDVPALLSVVEPGRGDLAPRDLEFRVRGPGEEPRWLRLGTRMLPGPSGLPARLLGTVADASRLRPGEDDVARVQQLAATLDTAVTVEDVSRVVVAALRRPLLADRVALAELASGRLVVTAVDPPEPEAWPEPWRRARLTGWPDVPARDLPTLEAALREGRTSVHPAGSPLEPALAGVGPGGLAVLPLPAAGQVLGACLVGWDEPHDLGVEGRALLTATAGLAGRALERARASDAAHELVGTLQRTLLPRRLPELPGGVAAARYLPATAGLEVGGDWYDVIPLPDGGIALVIGDVQGHSPQAATVMGQIRTAVRAYAVEGHPADVVLSHANRLLTGIESELFATCCYVALDLEDGSAWCVRAGHLPPVLRHADGRTELVETEGGPPLGVVPDAGYPLTPLRLAPGSVLVLTTDGLVETAAVSLDEGLERLREELARADPADPGLLADTLLGGAVRREDDVALLLLRYDGMAVRPLRVAWTVWRLPQAVAHARRFTARTLRSWGVRAVADTVLLVVSELVTNALVHTQGPVRLDLTLAGDRLRVAVNDSSPRAPVRPAGIDWEATGGRGVLLVEALSTASGSVPFAGGKQVWSEITLPPGEPAAP